MKTATLRILASILLFGITLLGSWERGAAQTGKWTSHVDPSLISEIVFRDGELYLGTSGGLLVYNLAQGSFDQFTNTIGLPSNFLTCLAFDDGGRLWVGTEDSGITRLERAGGGFQITAFSATFHGLSDDRITDLAMWGDTLVYATKEGAGLFHKDFSVGRFFEGQGLPSNVVNAVLPDANRVWMATDEGVVYLDEFGDIRDPSDNRFAGFSLERTDSAVWVGTETGVAYMKDGENVWVHTELGADPKPVFSLFFDGQKLWAGSRDRFYESDGSGWNGTDISRLFGKYDLSRKNRREIRALVSVPDGTLYLGGGDPASKRRGVHLVGFDGVEIREIPFSGIPANGLQRVTFDIDGSLWISTGNFGVAKRTPQGTWFGYNRAVEDTNLSSTFNTALLADSEGSKWFGTLPYPGDDPEPSPLDELRDELDEDYGNDSWFHHRIGDGGSDGLGSLRFQAANEDPAGNRWFLSDEDSEHAPGWWGINILGREGFDWRRVNPSSTDPSGELLGMKAGNVSDVAYGEEGLVYVGLKFYGVQLWVTGGYEKEHLFDFSDDTWITVAEIGERDGIESGAKILSLALRDDGILWIGTTVGVYRYDQGRLLHIPADRGLGTGLLSNTVADLLIDRDEDLWVATDLGLNRIARDDVNDISSFTTPIVWQTQLNLFFGPDAVSPLVNAKCRQLALDPSKNVLYIATAGGLSELDILSLKGQGIDVSKVYFYPNPIRPGKGGGHVGLKIGNVDSEVLVEVFTLEGELVHSQAASASEEEVWDLTTKSGFLAASGIYIVKITGVGGTAVKMVSLIR